MKDHLGESKVAKDMAIFTIQFDEDTQEKWIRLFELLTLEEETEEFETLLSTLRLASAEVGVDPWPIEVIDRMRKEGSWPSQADKSRSKNEDTDPLRRKSQPPVDFIQQFDEETQESRMRLFELHEKQRLTERETEEVDALILKLKLADAERSGDPIRKATVVAGELAFQQARNKARESGLSLLGVHIAATAAEFKAIGETPSEAKKCFWYVYVGAKSADGCGHLTSRDISEAIDEVKIAGLWPWKGLD
jgi:hypothetical protein